MKLSEKIASRIKQSQGNVFLRKDFADLGGYDQVGRALKQLIAEGLLVRIGQGIYAKARPSTINPSKCVLAAPGGFKQVSREALDRLGIKWRPPQAEEDYYNGISTQIPANAQVIVESRTTRKICYGNLQLDCSAEKKS